MVKAVRDEMDKATQGLGPASIAAEMHTMRGITARAKRGARDNYQDEINRELTLVAPPYPVLDPSSRAEYGELLSAKLRWLTCCCWCWLCRQPGPGRRQGVRPQVAGAHAVGEAEAEERHRRQAMARDQALRRGAAGPAARDEAAELRAAGQDGAGRATGPAHSRLTDTVARADPRSTAAHEQALLAFSVVDAGRGAVGDGHVGHEQPGQHGLAGLQ